MSARFSIGAAKDDELFAAEVCGLLEVVTATVYRSAHAPDAYRQAERRALLVAVDAAHQAALRYETVTDGLTFVTGDPSDSGPNGLSALLTKRADAELRQLITTLIVEGCGTGCSHEGCSSKNRDAYWAAVDRAEQLGIKVGS